MMLDAILSVLFVFFIGVLLRVLFARLFKKDVKGEEREITLQAKQPEAYATDKWVFVTYRGITLPMREHERINIWDTLSREGRNEQIEFMKKGLKQGKFQEYWPDKGTCMYVPKAANLIKIRDQYIAFKRGEL